MALAQAALAVHTTRLMGRLAAAELLRSAQRQPGPAALRERLAQSDPQLRRWLSAPTRRPLSAALLP